MELALRVSLAFGINDKLVYRQELIGKINGRIQVTARVAAQVEDHFFHSLLLQLFECVHVFIVGGSSKPAYLDIADLGSDHISYVNTIKRNFPAGNSKINRLGRTL